MKRAYYIDNLRIALTALVIIHHTAIAYGASGGWCYVTTDIITGWKQLTLSAFLSINQAFFMSLFFFISALFLPGSYEKKGFKKYLLDRLVRLGIPLVVYSTIINPCLNYLILLHTNNTTTDLFTYIKTSNIENPNTTHLWFLLALLIFETMYALYKYFLRFSISKYISGKPPSHYSIFLFIIITGGIAFLLRLIYPIGGKNLIGLQLGYFTLYIAMYVVGIIASRKKWIEKMSYKVSGIWFIIALAIVPLIFLAWNDVVKDPGQVAKYIGGFNEKALFLAYWEAIVCAGFCTYLVMAFKKYLNRSSSFFTNMALASYAAYIIHPLIVVGITILLETIILIPELKFITAGVLNVFLSFLIAYLMRQLPGVKRIL